MLLKKSPKCDLRSKYNRHLEISFIFALATLIAAFKLMPEPAKQAPIVSKPDDGIIVVVTPPTKTETELPPRPDIPSVIVEAPADADIIDDIIIEDPNTFIPTKDIPRIVEKDDEYVAPEFHPFAEVMPSPLGGAESLYRRLVYPDLAIKSGIQGTVIVQAYINEEGNVVRVELIKGIGAGCDEEALKAVKETVFNPGKQMDRPVKVQIKIPIKFVLR